MAISDTYGKSNMGERIRALRTEYGMSQANLACKLQLAGVDIDKNIITRIETNKRYANAPELRALKNIFGVSYNYLIDGVQDEQKESV